MVGPPPATAVELGMHAFVVAQWTRREIQGSARQHPLSLLNEETSMNRNVGLALGVFGGSSLLGGFLLSGMEIEAARPAYLVAITGGILSLLWGVMCLGGKGRKALSLATLIGMALVFLAQAVNGWFGEGDYAGRPLAPALITLLLAFNTVLLIMVAHAEVTRPHTQDEHVTPTPLTQRGHAMPAKQSRA